MKNVIEKYSQYDSIQDCKIKLTDLIVRKKNKYKLTSSNLSELTGITTKRLDSLFIKKNLKSIEVENLSLALHLPIDQIFKFDLNKMQIKEISSEIQTTALYCGENIPSFSNKLEKNRYAVTSYLELLALEELDSK